MLFEIPGVCKGTDIFKLLHESECIFEYLEFVN